MRYIRIIIFLTLPLSILAQNFDFKLQESKTNSLTNSFSHSINKSSLNFYDSVTSKTTVKKGSTKKPGVAFLIGLLVPGLGHVYSDNFATGKYFMITEAVTWLTFAAFTIYGNWLVNDAYDFAGIHAGVQVAGKEKDDKFFVDIANYDNVDEYNDEKLRFGEYDKLYYPELGYGFYWDSEESRTKYRGDKISGDRILNDRLFVVGAIVINHVISGISAVFAANSHNRELKQKGSGGISLRAGVQKHYNKVDGIKLSLTKWF